MAISSAEMQAKVDKTVVNMTRLNSIVNGDDNTEVQTDTDLVPSIAKFLKDMDIHINQEADGILQQTTDARDEAIQAKDDTIVAADRVISAGVTFNTFSDFASAEININTLAVFLNGYYAPRDGGQHLKVRIATPSPVKPWHVQSADGSWWAIKEVDVTPQMFGAKADATNIGVGTDDTVAIEKWMQYLIENKGSCGILQGTYRYNPTGPWNVGARNDGYTVKGRAKNGDGFYIDAGKTLAIEGANCFYHRFEHIHIRANVAGPAVRIGKNDYSDAFNSSSFILVVNNDSLNDAAEGTRFNYVLQSDINLVSNCGGSGRPGQSTTPGHGKAIVIRQACFNSWHLAAGQANVGLYLTDGAIFANHFVGFDAEEVAVGIRCDSPSASRNTFEAGQVLGSTTYDFTAGNFNVIRTAVNGVFYAGGSLGTNFVGVEIERLAYRSHIDDPAVPASGVYWTNNTGSKIFLTVFAGNVSLIRIKSTDGGIKEINPQVAGESVQIPVPPGWGVASIYTTAPAYRALVM